MLENQSKQPKECEIGSYYKELILILMVLILPLSNIQNSKKEDISFSVAVKVFKCMTKNFSKIICISQKQISQFYEFFIEEVDKENIENGQNSRVPAKSPSKRVLTTNLQSRNVLSYFELIYSITKNLSFILSFFLPSFLYLPIILSLSLCNFIMFLNLS